MSVCIDQIKNPNLYPSIVTSLVEVQPLLDRLLAMHSCLLPREKSAAWLQASVLVSTVVLKLIYKRVYPLSIEEIPLKRNGGRFLMVFSVLLPFI